MKYNNTKKQLKFVKNTVFIISSIMGVLTGISIVAVPEFILLTLMINMSFLGFLVCYKLVEAYLTDLIEEDQNQYEI